MDKNIVKLIMNTNIGYLATAASDLQPYATPVVFILQSDNVYVPLDHKPKTVSPWKLKRAKNIRENPKVCFLVHHYDEDWTKLWFIMMTGNANLLKQTSETLSSELKAIRTKFLIKYSQYSKVSIGNSYIRIRVDRTKYWKYTQLN